MESYINDFPPAFWQGVQEFNTQAYYACHDTLEALWMEAVDPDRTFYQGILQIAVALYHLSNHNWQGAVTLLGSGLGRLRSYGPHYNQVALEPLLRQGQALLERLQQEGAAAIAPENPLELFPKLEIHRVN